MDRTKGGAWRQASSSHAYSQVTSPKRPVVNVRTYMDVPARRAMSYRVRRAEGPFEFYLEFTKYPYQYNDLFMEMQNFYTDVDNQRENLLVSYNLKNI